MTDRNRTSGLERRAFLGGATAASMASVLAPRVAQAQPVHGAAPPELDGVMFWLKRKKLVGSYLLFSSARRVYFRSPYATLTCDCASSDRKLTWKY